MKKMMLLTALLGSAFVAQAAPVKNADAAYKMVVASVKKNKLTTLAADCVAYRVSKEGRNFAIVAYEVHNKKCGGDPNVSHRLFTYKVERDTGRMTTDAPRQGIEWDGDYHPIR